MYREDLGTTPKVTDHIYICEIYGQMRTKKAPILGTQEPKFRDLLATKTVILEGTDQSLKNSTEKGNPQKLV